MDIAHIRDGFHARAALLIVKIGANCEERCMSYLEAARADIETVDDFGALVDAIDDAIGTLRKEGEEYRDEGQTPFEITHGHNCLYAADRLELVSAELERELERIRIDARLDRSNWHTTGGEVEAARADVQRRAA